MFNITYSLSSVFFDFSRALRAFSLFILIFGVTLSLTGCTASKDEGTSSTSNSQRFAIAIPPELADVIKMVRFEVTDEDGNTQSAVVPLIPQGLPESVDPDLEGHSFADWFLVLNPGTYRIVATPLAGNDEPSDICGIAGGTVTIFDGITTEIVLVSNCDAHSGSLDFALVFNHNPFIEKLVIAPNKFLCIGKSVVINTRATDKDGDDLSYDWQVTDTPEGANESDYELVADNTPPWQAKFSAAVSGRYELTLSVSDGHGTTSLSFPIYVSDCDAEADASVRGVKWQDINGNAERDTNEPGLPGVIIYSDLNNNAEFDVGEPFTRTMRDDPMTDFDESGLYWLEGLRPGSHSIREIVPDGFVQTFPLTTTVPVTGVEQGSGVNVNPDAINVSLAAGETHDATVSISFDFLCFRPFDIDVIAPDAASGLVQNLSGVLVNGCGGDVSEFNIQLNGDGGTHNFELQFVDNEFGGILGTIPVQIAAPGGDGSHQVDLQSGDIIEGLDFGNQGNPNSASIHGRKWQDNNANGEQDTGEPGLAGVTIYIDLNQNGTLDQDEPRSVSMEDDPQTDFDESGRYWLEDLPPGNYIVREVVPDGFRQTFPPMIPPVTGSDPNNGFNVNPDALNVTLANGAVLDTQVSLTIEPFCFRPFEIDLAAPLAPSGVLQNLTGVLVNNCGGDTSTFDIRLTHTGGVISFDLEFVDAEFGGVIASLPVQISDSVSGFHAIQLDAGEVVEGIDFGNAPTL